MSVSFLSPYLLGLLPFALGFLVYIYRRRARSQTVVVPSLLFLRDITAPPRRKRRFFPPPRFFFELLLLTALIAGVAGMQHHSVGERVALVIDNSFSTMAKFRSEAPTKRIFDEVIAQANGELSNSRLDAVFEIYQLSPELKKVSEDDLSASNAREVLSSISPQYGVEDLAAALDNLGANTRYDRVVAVGDFVATSRNDQLRHSSVTLRPIRREDTTVENVALSQPSIRAGIGGSANVMRADITNYASAAVRGTVRCEVLLDIGSFVLQDEQRVNLANGEQKSLECSLPSMGARAARMEFSAAEGPGKFHGDALSEDNVVYAVVGAKGSTIAVLSTSSLGKLGLDQLQKFDFAKVSAEELLQADAPKRFAAAIVDQTAIDAYPGMSTLFIGIIPQQAPNAANARSRSALASWVGGHPLLTYIHPATLKFPEALLLSIPAWSESVAETDEGTVLGAGEYRGARFIFSGFTPLPYQAKRTPTLSVLFLNILSWLTQGGAQQSDIFLPAAISARAPDERFMILPEREKLLPATEVDRIALPHPGIVEARTDSGGLRVAAVNFEDASESNVLTPKPIAMTAKERNAGEQMQEQSVTWYIAAAAAFALLLEFLVLLLLQVRTRRARATA